MTSFTDKNIKLIFHHRVQSKNDLFTNMSELRSSNTNNKYSIIGSIEANKNRYKSKGYFEFFLEYPELKGCNHWKQSVFPTEAEAGASNGFVDLGSSYPLKGWGGLSKSSISSNTFLDGSPKIDSWYFPVGLRASYCDSYCHPNPFDSSSIIESCACLKDLNIYIVIPSTKNYENVRCTSMQSRFASFAFIILLVH